MKRCLILQSLIKSTPKLFFGFTLVLTPFVTFYCKNRYIRFGLVLVLSDTPQFNSKLGTNWFDLLCQYHLVLGGLQLVLDEKRTF